MLADAVFWTGQSCGSGPRCVKRDWVRYVSSRRIENFQDFSESSGVRRSEALRRCSENALFFSLFLQTSEACVAACDRSHRAGAQYATNESFGAPRVLRSQNRSGQPSCLAASEVDPAAPASRARRSGAPSGVSRRPGSTYLRSPAGLRPRVRTPLLRGHETAGSYEPSKAVRFTGQGTNGPQTNPRQTKQLQEVACAYAAAPVEQRPGWKHPQSFS
jgi:hypothetical protein